jgi:hypothetical protein
MPSPRTLAAAGSAVAALLLPATAGAATVTVTNDAGQPAPLTEGSPLQIRHMAPAVTPAFSASEKRYTLVITGPDGKSAGVDAVCVSTDGGGPQDIVYAGNGAYAVQLVTYADADDIYCEGTATTHNYTFVIGASVTLTGPASPLLYRDPGEGVQDLTFTYDINPGAGGYTLAWAYDAQFGAGGAIVGDYPKDGYGERGAGIIDGKFDDIRFPHAGNVSVVANAQAGNGTSPFSAPVNLKLMGPFDWSESPGFTGGRGRTHVIEAQVFEPGVVGQKVSVLLAKRSGKFKPFTSKTIPASRKLSFKIKKPRGQYRLKYAFAGAEFVTPGAWTQNLKIGKGRSAALSKLVRVAG